MRHPGAFPSASRRAGLAPGMEVVFRGDIYFPPRANPNPPRANPKVARQCKLARGCPEIRAPRCKCKNAIGGQHYRAKHQGAPKTIHRRAKRAPRLPYEFLRRRPTDVTRPAIAPLLEKPQKNRAWRRRRLHAPRKKKHIYITPDLRLKFTQP